MAIERDILRLKMLKLKKEATEHEITFLRGSISDRLRILAVSLVRAIKKAKISAIQISKNTSIKLGSVDGYLYKDINMPHHNYRLISTYVNSIINKSKTNK